MAKATQKITASSTAEYFAKNLQQVGFSSQTKAVLTTLKEAVDNALDACEENGILPEVHVEVERKGVGSLKNSEQIRIKVLDNGPGIDPDDISRVFGEYLASSKFGRGRCSRGQQGIGISAATTWAQLTSATGARVITKTKNMRKAISAVVEVDIKNNKGVIKDKETIDWDRPHGTSVEFLIDGRIQINGEAGIMNYLMGNVLVNPHMTLHYKLPDMELVSVPRVTDTVPEIPEATAPHPHTMKLGEFIAHSHLFGRMSTSSWLKKGFSRVSEQVLDELVKVAKVKKALLDKSVDGLNEEEFKTLFTGIQNLQLRPPSTQSVLSIGEEAMGKSIRRIGDVDFFSVMSRKPTICDFKPIQIEVAVARLKERTGEMDDSPVQVLRFANRVPLQFDKAACAIVKAITTVNWRAYGLAQPKNSLPTGPYIVAVSVVSPFIKFKNASKETVDASDELVEEIRRALMQAGQRLSRHIRREHKEAELESRIRHIEQFAPILVEGLCRITGSPDSRKKKAEEGLAKLLGRDASAAEQELEDARMRLEAHMESERQRNPSAFEKGADAAAVASAAARSPGGVDVVDIHEMNEEAVAESEDEDSAKKKAKGKKKSPRSERDLEDEQHG